MNYRIKSSIWIEDSDSNVLLGGGRVELLKAVEKTGSLSKAAKSIKMSYKKAWKLLNAVNRLAAKETVITSIGGKNGGGTQLTPYGRELIQAFDDINKDCWAFLDKQVHKINEL